MNPSVAANRQRIVKCWESMKFPTVSGVSTLLQMDRAGVRRHLLAAGIEIDSTNSLSGERQERKAELKALQDMIAPKLSNVEHFTGDAAVSADYHVPAVDLRMVKWLIKLSKDNGIDNLYIVGDLFNFDAISFYAKKIGGDGNLPKLTDELKIGLEVLQLLSASFKKIIYSAGNHEERFNKALSNQVGWQVLVEAMQIPNLTILTQSHFYLDEIRCTHPRTYRMVKLSTARSLAEKYNGPVMQSHGHFSSTGFSVGNHRIVDLGCMCDPERVIYVNGPDTAHPIWNRGFVIYKDRQIYNYAPGFGIDLERDV